MMVSEAVIRIRGTKKKKTNIRDGGELDYWDHLTDLRQILRVLLCLCSDGTM